MPTCAITRRVKDYTYLDINEVKEVAVIVIKNTVSLSDSRESYLLDWIWGAQARATRNAEDLHVLYNMYMLIGF